MKAFDCGAAVFTSTAPSRSLRFGGQLPLSCQRLLHCGHPLRIQFWQTFKQAVGADLQNLADASERQDGARNFSAFDVADGLPVNAYQFGETLLREISLQTRCPHVLADAPQDLADCHPLFQTTPCQVLTSNIFDSSVSSTNNPKITNMKISPLSLLALLSLCLVGCFSSGRKLPTPTAGFSPKRTYAVSYVAAWPKVQLALDNARVSVTSATKDDSVGRIQTDYVDGPSRFIVVAAQATRYRYSITVRPDGDKTKVGIVAKVESTMNSGKGSSQWSDVSGQNAALVSQLEDWLYEQIEKEL